MKIILTIIIIIITSTQVSADTIIESGYFNNKTLNWNKSGSPYIIDGPINLSSSTLNIVDAKIIIRSGSISLYNNSIVNIKDTTIENMNEKYTFSLFNSNIYSNNLSINVIKFIEAYNSNLAIDSLNSLSFGTKDFISLYNSSSLNIQNSYIENYKGDVFNIYNANNVYVKNNAFINNTRVFGIHSANTISINYNDFEHNNIAIESYIPTGDFENNYFEKDYPTIYSYKEDASISENNILAGPFKISIFSKVKNIKKPEICCSNVVFLPGVMGSRLYINGVVENQLWEPNRNTDVKKLYLDEFGKSINNIFTKDIIVKTNLLGGLPYVDKDIYRDFDDYLKRIKSQKIIVDYNSVPYDWRMSADYILDQGIKLKDKNIDLVQVVKDLQKTSKTGKVTIITHSNGGLIAKQLVLELKKVGLENTIDKIVFVAMPEYGTAQAITALMFGHNQSLGGGLIMRSSIARELAKNMPTAYTLLPSDKYYTYNIHADKLLQETVIRNYSRVNMDLLNKSKLLHQELDNIVYPENIKVYQIIGTGINTLSDIKLDDKNMFKIIPLYTKAGDGVVQDLYSSRSGHVIHIDLKGTIYKHVNIMNSDKVISNINNIINPKIDIPEQGLDYYKIIKNNNYKLLKISPSNPNNKLSEYLTPLEMDLSVGISKIKDNTDNELYFDKFSASTNNIFREVRENLNDNRFELYDDNIHYLYTTDIENFSIKPKTSNTIDISIIESIDGEISESEYKNIEIFKDSELIFNVNNESNSLDMSLPLTGKIIQIQNVDKIPEITTDEKINKIISEIKSSNMDFYLKDRYIRRIEVYRQNKDEKYLQTLKARIVSSIDSIGKLSYSPTLKSRYSRLREYYILLNFLLLKL